MSGLTFASPVALLALLLVPAVLAFAWAIDRRRARYPVVFTNLEVLASVTKERRQWKRLIPLTVLLLALATAATALARPRASFSVPVDNATIVFLVDVSGSMRADDVEPTRLDAAISAMNTFLDRLPKRFKVGVVAFSTDAETIQTPTDDRQLVRDALSYLQPEAGTAIGDGLAAAVKTAVASLERDGVRRVPGEPRPAAIVLESDGTQNQGALTALQGAERARAAGIRVDGVALGTPNGVLTYGFGLFVNTIPVPPDPQVVRDIARITGGKALEAQDAGQAKKIYAKLGSSIGRESKSREITSYFASSRQRF